MIKTDDKGEEIEDEEAENNLAKERAKKKN